MKKIGFIGLGVMGKPMAKNLVESDYNVTVFDLNENAMQELADHGADTASNLQQLASECDLVITMLPNSPHVKDVTIGEDGLIHVMNEGSTIIDMSSISPEVTKEIYATLKKKNINLIDAPVSGGRVGAEAGKLSIMVGGDEDTFESVKDVLSCLGQNISYMGSSGAGQTTKICNQIICAGTAITMSESIALGKKAGLDLNKLRDVLMSGGANCWHLEHKMPPMIEGDFQPSFKTELLFKDINLAVEKAEAEGLELEVLRKSKEMYEKLIEDLGGQDDYTVIVKQIYKDF